MKNSFKRFADKTFWDNRNTPLGNQNRFYADELNRYAIERKKFIIDQLIQKYDPTQIVDFGCGSGAVMIPLVKKYPTKHFIGIDFSLNNLNNLEDRLHEYHNYSVFLRDISDIHLRDDLYNYFGKIDFGYSLDVLCHLTYSSLVVALQNIVGSCENVYYVFHAVEYSNLFRYKFLFDKLKFLPKTLRTKLILHFTKKSEQGLLPTLKLFSQEENT